MSSEAELKKSLADDFNGYVQKYIANFGTISGSANNIADSGSQDRKKINFPYPKINESDPDPGAGASSPVLDKIFPAPADSSMFTLPHYDSLTNLRNGVKGTPATAYVYVFEKPGWKQYFDSLSKARQFGYEAIFLSIGLSNYIMSQDEYKQYIEDLKSSPNYGQAVVQELIDNGWLTDPSQYGTGAITPKGAGSPIETREGQIRKVAQALWHWQNSKKIMAFIDSYRWFPYAKPLDLKNSDISNNKDRIAAYKDDVNIISSTNANAYGKVNASGQIDTVDPKFKDRYSKKLFTILQDILYSTELELKKINPEYSGNLFEELVEGDRILRRKRALDSLLKDDKLDPELFEEKVWKAQIEASYSKFIEYSKKEGIKGYKKDKNGEFERDKDTGALILIEFTPAQYIEQILSGSSESFIAALNSIKISPKYRAWRTDPGGLPAVLFVWEPDPEKLREIFILKAYADDPDKINSIIFPKTPLADVDAPKSEGGVIRKIFGEKVGFKSGESSVSTSGGFLLTPEQRKELKEERRQARVEKREERENKKDGASVGSGSNSVGVFEAKAGSPEPESSSVVGGATNITNINNQEITANDQNKTINEGSNVLNSKDNTNLMVKNESPDSSGSGGSGSSQVNVNTANETKSVANINNASTVSGSDKSVDMSQTNPSISNTQNELSKSINNSNVGGSAGSNQSLNTSVTNSNPVISSPSINNQNESNINSSNIANNIKNESKGSDVKVDRSQVNVSNLKSNSVNSESLTASSQNSPMISGGDANSSTVNNITSQNEGDQTAGNVTNNTDNSMSKTPIIQNNIDMSEMISRLKRIEEALLSPLEVKIIDA